MHKKFSPRVFLLAAAVGLAATIWIYTVPRSVDDAITGLRNDSKAGTVKMLETDRSAELAHTMLNAGKAPFDNLNARLAVAYASDRNALNQLTNNEVSQTWDQPFAPQTLGYQKSPGFPTYDPKKASGLDGAMRTIAQAPFGGIVLTLVALGLAAFGAFCFARARYPERT